METKTQSPSKLELTLCNLLPYGLMVKLKTDNQSYLLKGVEYVRGELSLTAISSICVEAKITDWKPYLFSLSKLTEPVLENGEIPIVELAKMAGYSEFDDSEDISKLENKQVHSINRDWFAYDNGFIGGNEYGTIGCKDQLLLFEKLKEWHFNIYDLPIGEYIEKSTLTKQ